MVEGREGISLEDHMIASVAREQTRQVLTKSNGNVNFRPTASVSLMGSGGSDAVAGEGDLVFRAGRGAG